MPPGKIVGIELQKPSVDPELPGEYFRVVRHHSTLYIRSGRRDQVGTLTTSQHATPRIARTQMFHLLDGHPTLKRTDTVCSLSIPLLPYLDADTPLDVEQIFIDTWRAGVFGDRDGAAPLGPMWVSVAGVLTEEGLNVEVDTILAALRANPHTVDATCDRIVGQLPRLPYLSLRSSSSGMIIDTKNRSPATPLSASWIARVDPACVHGTPACLICSQRLADLLCFFSRGIQIDRRNEDDRARVYANARRLVRTQARPAPV